VLRSDELKQILLTVLTTYCMLMYDFLIYNFLILFDKRIWHWRGNFSVKC